MLISDSYKQLNEELHYSNAGYGTSGHKWADAVVALADSHNTSNVLDYGCGKSTLAESLPFLIRQYDPCIKEYCTRPEAADIVVCTDVLEHIEPDCIDDVIGDVSSLIKICGFIFVSTRPANKELSDGRNAHLIQMPGEWWFSKLQERFKVTRPVIYSKGISVVIT